MRRIGGYYIVIYSGTGFCSWLCGSASSVCSCSETSMVLVEFMLSARFGGIADE